MTGNEYQALAMRTAVGRGRCLSNAALGLAGESGEVADIIKKHMYQGHSLKSDEICKELGDVMWYVALAAEMCGLTLDEVMQSNIDKLKKRYPDGFSEERSVNRDE